MNASFDHDPQDDPLIAALRQAQEDGTKLTRAGTGASEASVIEVNGRTYNGIAAIPWTDLIAVNREDLLEQGYSSTSAGALLAHRTRRLKRAAQDGTFSAAQLTALREAGVL